MVNDYSTTVKSGLSYRKREKHPLVAEKCRALQKRRHMGGAEPSFKDAESIYHCWAVRVRRRGR